MKASRFLILALLAVIVSLSLHKIYDPDFWWQLAAGDRMREAGAILRANTLSFTHPQHDWLDVYWLYQLVLSWLWQCGGAIAITAFRVTLVLALGALVLFGFRNRREPLSPGEAAVLLFGCLLMAPRLTDRPELVTFVLLAATIVLLRRRRWWWCVPLEVIWANVHGFFFLGPVIIAATAANEWITGNRRAAGPATLATGAVVAASCLSPFGWRNWIELPRLATTMQTLAGSVEELVSPFHAVARMGDGSGWLLVVFVSLAVMLLTIGYKAVRPFDWIIMAVTLPMALAVRRGIPLFTLCALPALLTVVPRLDKSIARVGMIGLCVVLAGILRVRGREFGVGMDEREIPRQAVEFIEQKLHGPVRLFNAGFSTGGYLAARGLAVFVDGRLEAYPTEFLRRCFAATEDDTVFVEMAREFDVTHALIVTTATETRCFAQRVLKSRQWTMLYADDIAVVLERKP